MPLTQLWPTNITIKAVTLTCVTVMLCCVMTNKKLARVTMVTMTIKGNNGKQYC